MGEPRIARWLEACLWLLIVIRTASVVFVPSNAARVPLVLVGLRPTGDVLLASVPNSGLPRLVAVAVVAVLSRLLLNIAMFVLLVRYAPGLSSRLLPQRQLRIVERLRSTRTRSALLVICSVHPTKIVVVACALATVRLLGFVISALLGNAFVVTLYLTIGRRYSAELQVVISWITARSEWITLALVPVVVVVIIVAAHRARR